MQEKQLLIYCYEAVHGICGYVLTNAMEHSGN